MCPRRAGSYPMESQQLSPWRASSCLSGGQAADSLESKADVSQESRQLSPWRTSSCLPGEPAAVSQESNQLSPRRASSCLPGEQAAVPLPAAVLLPTAVLLSAAVFLTAAVLLASSSYTSHSPRATGRKIFGLSSPSQPLLAPAALALTCTGPSNRQQGHN